MTAIGDELPTQAYTITATRIVAGAIASRDFMPAHHHTAFAQSQGSPDIFLNILSTNAWCSRYLTDWAGPDAILRRLSIGLGVPAYPDSTLTFQGAVTDIRQEDGEQVVDVEFSASNDLGEPRHRNRHPVLRHLTDRRDARACAGISLSAQLGMSMMASASYPLAAARSVGSRPLSVARRTFAPYCCSHRTFATYP